jgi:hypothetical protein
MPDARKYLLTFATAAVLVAAAPRTLPAADEKLLPPGLPMEQRDNLLRFLQQHEKADRFVPADAKIVSTSDQPPPIDLKAAPAPGKPVKQYMVQILSQRPVPGEEAPKRVDVYYYRPNPERGKPGITVKHTVDLTTGKQVGQTEVLLNRHTPLSRDEVEEAVTLAREKSPAVQALYKGREKGDVRYEYLTLFVNRKHEQQEPGDRAVRLVFMANPAEGQAPPEPVRVIVNLTKEIVVPDLR